MEEKLRALEGITYREWQKLKLVIDNKFAEIKYDNILDVSKDTVEELKNIN